MSRIGKAPVSIPKGVKASVSGRTLTVEGPLGKLVHTLHPAVSVEVDAPANAIKVTIPRSILAGNPDDTDIDGKQQHAPLLDIEIPL